MTRNPGLRCSGMSGGLDPAYTERNAGSPDFVSAMKQDTIFVGFWSNVSTTVRSRVQGNSR